MANWTMVPRLVTEIVQPPVVLSVMFVLSTATTAGWPGNFYFGLIAATFTCILPWLATLVLVHLGRVSDHHVGDRKQRAPILISTLISAAVGGGLLLAFGAPKEVFVMLGAFVAGIIFMIVISPFWKVSGHATSIAGATTIAVLMFGQPALWLFALPPLVGWSRIYLDDHSAPQVMAGLSAGVIVIGGFYSILS